MLQLSVHLQHYLILIFRDWAAKESAMYSVPRAAECEQELQLSPIQRFVLDNTNIKRKKKQISTTKFIDRSNEFYCIIFTAIYSFIYSRYLYRIYMT